MANTDIAERTATSRPTVLKWRGRYAECGIAGLDDDPRAGRAPVIDEVAVLAETLTDKGKPPAHLGVTHRSARLMAARLGISFASVARIWRKWNIQPQRVETFKFSTDPQLEAKLRDVVGLYWGTPAEQALAALGNVDPNASSHVNRFVQIGDMAGPSIALPAGSLRSAGIELVGMGFGSVPAVAWARAAADHLPRLFDMVAGGRLHLQTERRPLSQVEEVWTRKEPSGTRAVFVPDQ